MTNAKDNINTPIDSCSIDLNQFDEQNPTDDYKFDFVASKLVVCRFRKNY